MNVLVMTKNNKIMKVFSDLLVFITLLYMSLFMASCTNAIEKKITGNYKAFDYNFRDSSKNVFLPELVLQSDNTFLLKYSNRYIKGKWDAGDNGDFTWIDFEWIENGQKRGTEGQIVGKNYEIISIYMPRNFYSSSFKKLSFKRQEK